MIVRIVAVGVFLGLSSVMAAVIDGMNDIKNDVFGNIRCDTGGCASVPPPQNRHYPLPFPPMLPSPPRRPPPPLCPCPPICICGSFYPIHPIYPAIYPFHPYPTTTRPPPDRRRCVKRARAYIFKARNGSIPTEPIGVIDFVQRGPQLRINGTVRGLKIGMHGFHIHEKGNGCMNAGGHYNPLNMKHGGPMDRVRHVGDLGNIETKNNKTTPVSIIDYIARLRGQYSIVGRAIVIHEDGDDLGRGGHSLSSITGNSGRRLACGIIGIIE